MNRIRFTSGRRGGLECGASGAKLVLLSKHDSTFQVEQIFIEEYPFELRIKGKTRSPLDIVRRLLIHKNLSGCQITFAANDAVKSCFTILPKMNKAEMQSAVLLQAKKLLSWETPHSHMAYVSSEFLANHTGTLVGLADWPAVKPWCRLIEGSGGRVNELTLEACAYQALADRQGLAHESPVFLVADIGAESSLIYIFDRQTVRFMRKVPVGGDAVTKMLTTEVSTDSGPIRLTDIDAEEVKISGRLTPATGAAINPEHSTPGRQQTKLAEHINMLVRPVVERLSSEIARSIQFYKDNVGQRVEAVYITGGTAGLRTLKTHLETSLALPVKMIDPFAGLTFANPAVRNYAEKHKTRLALAVGLALVEEPVCSLLPSHMKVLKKCATFVPEAVAALLLLGFLPFIIGGTSQMVKIQAVRAANKEYQAQVQRAGEERRRLETLQRQFREASDRYAAFQQTVGRDPLWPGIFNALADAIPRDIVLTHFGAGSDPQQPNIIMLEGNVLPSAAGFDDALAALLSSLSAAPFFKQVSIVRAQSQRTETMLGSFEIQCELIY